MAWTRKTFLLPSPPHRQSAEFLVEGQGLKVSDTILRRKFWTSVEHEICWYFVSPPTVVVWKGPGSNVLHESVCLNPSAKQILGENTSEKAIRLSFHIL